MFNLRNTLYHTLEKKARRFFGKSSTFSLYIPVIYMETTILASATIGIILYYFYQTDVISTYLELFVKNNQKWKAISLIGAFNEKRKNEPNLRYLDYLNQTYRTFWTKLISCPVCFGFFLSLLISIITLKVHLVFAMSFFGIVLYGLLKLLLNKPTQNNE